VDPFLLAFVVIGVVCLVIAFIDKFGELSRAIAVIAVIILIADSVFAALARAFQ